VVARPGSPDAFGTAIISEGVAKPFSLGGFPSMGLGLGQNCREKLQKQAISSLRQLTISKQAEALRLDIHESFLSFIMHSFFSVPIHIPMYEFELGCCPSTL